MIDRFVAPEEENKEQKRGRGLLDKKVQGTEADDSLTPSRLGSEETGERSRTRDLRRTSARVGKERYFDETEEGSSSRDRRGEKITKQGKGWIQLEEVV